MKPPPGWFLAVDVTDSGQVEAMAKKTIDAFGRIDVLHNNVGIAEVGGPVEASEESWDRVHDVNLKSAFLTCKHVIPQMQALCDMIHEVDPNIPIYSSTWKHVPAWDGYLDVWGIGHYGRVPVDEMREMAARGDRLWFTTDGQMCTDTPACAVERLLPHYCFKYGAQAYDCAISMALAVCHAPVIRPMATERI